MIGRLTLGVLSAFTLTVAANAADLPVKMPVKAVVPPAAFDWSGFYIGGFYGTSLAQSKATVPTAADVGTIELNDGGIAVGGTIGVNWQFSPAGLLGAEADLGWLGTSRDYQDFNDFTTRVSVKSRWYGTLRGRLGYVTGPSLLYVTGGAAAVRLDESLSDTIVGLTGISATRWGWTVGGGIETKLSRAWSITTEYLYIDAGSNSFPSNAGDGSQVVQFDNRFHLIKSGLNYKFGEPLEPLPLFAGSLSSPLRWAGLYAGVNAGGGLSLVRVPNSVYDAIQQGEDDISGGGFAGGGQIGYNWVVFSNYIAGVEGDVGYLGIEHFVVDWYNTGIFGRLFQPAVRTDWYGTLRGRVGVSTGPAFSYLTGGAAFAHVNDSDTFDTASASSEKIRSGWVLGGGIETELNARWSARIEYLYIDVGSDTLTNALGTSEFKNRFEVIRAGLNYKLGGL